VPLLLAATIIEPSGATVSERTVVVFVFVLWVWFLVFGFGFGFGFVRANGFFR